MKQGKLYYSDEMYRYSFVYLDEDGTERDYEGLHCGECMEVYLNGIWVPTRIEMGDDWYLVGLPGIELSGMEIRMG